MCPEVRLWGFGFCVGLFFFFSTAERAIKHCRSSGYIRNYDQKDACCTCKTQKQTQKTNTNNKNPTHQGTARAVGKVKTGETVRHPKRPQ